MCRRALVAALVALALPSMAAASSTVEVVDVDTRAITVVADDHGRLAWGYKVPRWSADGQSILTIGDRVTRSTWIARLFRIPLAGGAEQPVRRLSGFDHSLSPHGLYAAELSDSGFATRRGGVAVRELATGRVTARLPQHAEGDDLYESSLGAVWSADDRRLALVALERGGATLRVVDTATGKLILRQRRPGGLSPGSFAPDGERLAFMRGEHIVILDLRTGQRRRLPVWGYAAEGVAWSPDGTRLAVAQYKGIAIVDPATGWGPTLPLAPSSQLVYSGGSLRWSPDGTAVSYIASEDYDSQVPRSVLLTMPVEPTVAPARVIASRNAAGFGQPSWSPDGKRIVFTAWRD
jgi:dipeptidyl aminopeptidase/acylaminoacyl peptidase